MRQAKEAMEREAREQKSRSIPVESRKPLLDEEKIRAEAALRASAQERAAKDEELLKRLNRDRETKEIELAKRTESARKILDELKEAKATAHEEHVAKRAPPPTMSMPAAPGKDVEEEIRSRQEFLRKTRDALVARKAKERAEEAAKFATAHGGSSGSAPNTLGSLGDDAAEQERIKMRVALGARMKQDMIDSEDTRKGDKTQDEINAARRRVAKAEAAGDLKALAMEEATLANLQKEADRRRALETLHANLKKAPQADDFTFSEN